LGRLYIDPFQRANKLKDVWCCNLWRPANKVRNLDKLVYLIGSAEEPDSNGQSLLHYEQLKQLLFYFGRAIQYLLSRSPYFELTIPNHYYADCDAVDFFPNFMKFFIYKPNLLKSLSSPNVKSGEYLNDHAAWAFSLALARSTFWESYRSLFWSDYDLSLFTLPDWKKKFWLDLYKSKFKEYFPIPMEANNYHPSSFTPMFHKAPLVGNYYRKLWSEMMALDTHETFDHENNVVSTGERLKTTMLNYGSGELQGYLYNRFQGRDPAVGAICDFYDPPEGLLEDPQTKQKYVAG